MDQPQNSLTECKLVARIFCRRMMINCFAHESQSLNAGAAKRHATYVNNCLESQYLLRYLSCCLYWVEIRGMDLKNWEGEKGMKGLSRSFFIFILAAALTGVLPQYVIEAEAATAKETQILRVPSGKEQKTTTKTTRTVTTTTTTNTAPKTVTQKKIQSPVTKIQKPASGGIPAIISVRTGMNAGKTRIVIETDRAITFRAFTLGNPWRLIVDVPDVKWKTAQNKLLTSDLLKGYRSGSLDNGLMRLAFDLRKPAVIDSAFVLPAQNDNKDRIVIDLSPASQNLFDAREKQAVGDENILENKSGVLPPPKALPRDMMPIRTARDNNVTTVEPEDDSATAASSDDNGVDMPPLPLRKPTRLQQETDEEVVGSAKKQVVTSGQKKKSKYTVVIDAGHGGADPGALGVGNVQEKNITLAVARELKRQLEETGRYKVVMTRDRDIYIPLRERVDISREKGGDVFISIHADKVDRSVTRGASIYTLSSTASDAETARLADQENNSGVVAGVDLSSESHDVAGILLDLSMREKMNESNLLASYLREGLSRESVRLLPNSHRSAGFAVLKAPDVPAALIETGFLSNPDEVKLLNSGAFQRKLAGAIVKGIDAFFTKIEALQGL